MNVIIKENSDQKLKLLLKPTGCLYVGAGLILVLGGLWVIWILGKSIKLTVENDTLHYESSRLGLAVQKEFTVATKDISEISLLLKEGFSPTYKVTVQSGETAFEADLPLSDGDEKRAIVDQLKAATSQAGGRFAHEEDGIIGALLLGGVCVVGGLICWLALQTVSLTANRAIGYLQIRRRRQLLPFGDRREIDLAEYRGIEAKEVSVRTASGQEAGSYQLVVRRKGGKPMPVAHGPMFTEASAQEVVQLVEDWIDKAESDPAG